jgi:hypothetical protein
MLEFAATTIADRRSLLAATWLAAGVGCGGDGDRPPRGDVDPTETATTGHTGTPPSHTGTESTTTGDTGEPPAFDCSTVPSEPLSITPLDAPRGYHDLVFDPLGHIIGSDLSSLIQAEYDGTVGVFLPGTGIVQGMDWLPNGDLVYADAVGSIQRVTPAGQRTVLATNGGGYLTYGVTVGPDGKVYTGTWTTVEQHDPATGRRNTLLSDPGVDPYVVDFSPDHRTMYIGTIWNGGIVWSLPLGDDLLPVGPPAPFVKIGEGDDPSRMLHDALAVDVCGNLYVAEYYTNNLYRVTPEGEASVLVDFDEVTYGHGIEWGSGIGGWRSDALYLPQPYRDNHVVEVVIGVPSRESAER